MLSRAQVQASPKHPRRLLLVCLTGMFAVVGAGLGVAVSFVALAAAAGVGTVAAVTVALAAGGWAFGHLQPGLLTAVANAVDERHFGMSTSLQQPANQIGAVVGMGLFTAVAADARSSGPFVLVYLMAALSALCGAVLGLWLDDRIGAFVPAAVVADDGHEPAVPDHLVHPLTEHESRVVIT